MARRTSFMTVITRTAREMERQQRRAIREREQQVKALQRAHEKAARERAKLAAQVAKNQKEQEKERQRQYTASREADIELKNAELDDRIATLESVLSTTLEIDDYIDLDELKEKPEYPPLEILSQYTSPVAEPEFSAYEPPAPTGISAYLPNVRSRYASEFEIAKKRYEADLAKAREREAFRLKRIAEIKAAHAESVAKIDAEIKEQHSEIEEFKGRLEQGSVEAILDYFRLVLESSVYPDDFPQQAKLAYIAESRQLVIEYDLPTLDIVPEEASFKYVKARDEITSTSRAASQRKALYASLIAQVTLRTIHEVFEADRGRFVDTVVFNGHVDVVDKATGRDIRPCLVTLRTTKDVFGALDLSRVDPQLCLKNLNAGVSQNPSELAPVRPVLEFNMVDPRFVEEVDVMSSLDTRPNLMELSPTEFESLITNLFHKMGLEARTTQASRDGGVDCVAWDPRPIFGGKVIIQAKRYKNTVGVSAVRDLYGTLQNEGASKGILVTTSGYGKAAYEFAQNKPLELLDGSNLLYLLAEHAEIDARIEIPDSWIEPEYDTPSA
ncbi:MAG: restriction endonuclease [Chloroflexi bacterium]|nr:restriction endonuclease [Chloroflexota bacterium]